MHVAEGVLDVGVVAVRLEPVVDRDPAEVGEHACVVKAIEPASVVQRVERRLLGAGAEQPPQLPSGASAGLVEMRDRRRGDLSVHPIQERREILGAAAHERGQRPGRDRHTKPVRHQPSGPHVGKVLIADQIQPQCPHPRPVQGRRADPVREPSRRLIPAPATARVRTMLAGTQPDLRKIEHLTGEMPDIVTV